MSPRNIVTAFTIGLVLGRKGAREAGYRGALRSLLEAVETEEEAIVLKRIADRAAAKALRKLAAWGVSL